MAYDGWIYFSNAGDGRLYRVQEGRTPEPVTPGEPSLCHSDVVCQLICDTESTIHRFADFTVYPNHQSGTHLVSVLEDHTIDTPQTVRNTLCVINTTTKHVSELQGIEEADFFAAPAFSPDGTKLVWQQWYHDMPWEGAELYVADVVGIGSDSVSGLRVTNAKHIAGKKLDISAAYPSWANNDTLVFTSDESGYQNPWTYSISTNKAQPVFSNTRSEDFSSPAWTLGGSPYVIVDDSGNMALFAAFRDGRNVLYLVDLKDGTQRKIDPCPFVTISKLRRVAPGKPEFVFSASRSDGPGGVVRCTLSSLAADSTPTYTILKSTEPSDSASAQFPAGIISLPQPCMLHIPQESNLLPVIFYAPTNPAYEGSSIPGEKPPCVIDVHGGKYHSLCPQRQSRSMSSSTSRPDRNGITSVELVHTILYQPRMGLVCNLALRNSERAHLTYHLFAY
jgi:hypothetical protein